MRTTKYCRISALLAGLSLWAQNPPGAAVDNKFDTPQVHVYVATLLPHTPVASRTGHATDRVLIYLDAGRMTRQDGTDKLQNIEFHRGEVRWRPASSAYVAENISDHPIRILEIDLKSKSKEPAIRQWWMRNTIRSNSKTTRCASYASITIRMTRGNNTNTS
jgi:hypothetical protein